MIIKVKIGAMLDDKGYQIIRRKSITWDGDDCPYCSSDKIYNSSSISSIGIEWSKGMFGTQAIPKRYACEDCNGEWRL